MSSTGRKRRKKARFVAYVHNSATPKALRDQMPLLGRRMDGPEPPKSREDWSLKARLVADLGPRGYGALLRQLEATATRPRRKRRRKKVAA